MQSSRIHTVYTAKEPDTAIISNERPTVSNILHHVSEANDWVDRAHRTMRELPFQRDGFEISADAAGHQTIERLSLKIVSLRASSVIANENFPPLSGRSLIEPLNLASTSFHVMWRIGKDSAPLPDPRSPSWRCICRASVAITDQRLPNPETISKFIRGRDLEAELFDIAEYALMSTGSLATADDGELELRSGYYEHPCEPFFNPTYWMKRGWDMSGRFNEARQQWRYEKQLDWVRGPVNGRRQFYLNLSLQLRETAALGVLFAVMVGPPESRWWNNSYLNGRIYFTPAPWLDDLSLTLIGAWEQICADAWLFDDVPAIGCFEDLWIRAIAENLQHREWGNETGNHEYQERKLRLMLEFVGALEWLSEVITKKVLPTLKGD